MHTTAALPPSPSKKETPLEVIVKTMENEVKEGVDAKELPPINNSTVTSTVIKLPVPSEDAADSAVMMAENYNKSRSREQLCKDFFKVVIDCLKPTAEANNVSVDIAATANSLIATNAPTWDSKSRLDVIVGTEVGLLAAMTVAHVLQLRFGKDASKFVKHFLHNASIFCNAFAFAYDSGCHFAAYYVKQHPEVSEDNGTLNAMLGIIIGLSFLLGTFVKVGHNKAPDSLFRRLSGATFFGLASANFCSTIGRLWKYSDTTNSYTEEKGNIVDYVALGAASVTAVVTFFSSPLRKKAHAFSSVNNVLYDLGTYFENGDFNAITANALLVSKAFGLLSFALLHRHCTPKIGDKMDSPLLDNQHLASDSAVADSKTALSPTNH